METGKIKEKLSEMPVLSSGSSLLEFGEHALHVGFAAGLEVCCLLPVWYLPATVKLGPLRQLSPIGAFEQF